MKHKLVHFAISLASYCIIVSIGRCNALRSPIIVDDHPSTTELIPLPDGLTGPESFAFGPDGEGPYTGVSDGRILKWRGGELGWMEHAVVTPQHLLNECRVPHGNEKDHLCGRPLGLQFNKRTRELYIADAYLGLMKVSEGEKFAEQIVTQAQNQPLRFTNGLDIDQETGIVHFTDSSLRFQKREVTLIFISGDKTELYNPQTKEVRVLLNGLSFANSQDASFLLIAETATCRILRHWLRPNKTKTSAAEVFISPLPRLPDNIKPSPRGGFWVAQYSRRERESLTGSRLCPLGRWDEESLALRVSEEGEVLEMLEDFGDKMVKYVSEVKEFNGSLWIGSVVMPHVGIYKL